MNFYRTQRYMLRYELAAFIKENQFGYGAEIDVKGGEPFVTVLKKNPQLFMVGVDPWNNDDGIAEKKCRERCRPYEQRARLVKGDASRVAFGFSKGVFDFVFYHCYNDCDGNYEYHKKILQNWSHKTKPGGYLVSCGFHVPMMKRVLADMGYTDIQPAIIRGKESSTLKYVRVPEL